MNKAENCGGQPILPINKGPSMYTQETLVKAMFREGGMLEVIGDQTANESLNGEKK